MRKNKKKKTKGLRIVAMVLGLTLLIGCVALVLVENLMPTQQYIPQNIVSLPSRVVSAVLKPFQSAFSWTTNYVSDYLANFKLRKTIEIEYNKLRAENDELTYKSLLNDELEAENERLRNMLNVFDEKKSMNPIMAQVTGKETSSWFQMFTIDKGSRQGVKENMAVINADGLIGYIYKVYETTSEVISIVDSRASVAALIESSRDQGIVKGTLGIEEDAACRMYYLPVDLVPRPGDTVVTSGVGLSFPKGLKIGVIRESTRYMDENKHYVVIEPYVDFMHIEEVVVLIYEAAQEDMPDANDGQLSYVPSVLDTPRPSPSIGAQVNDPNLGAVTPPPRATRMPGESIEPEATVAPTGLTVTQMYEGADAFYTIPPDATPTPNPELDELMRQELESEGEG
mgnify:FL=1